MIADTHKINFVIIVIIYYFYNSDDTGFIIYFYVCIQILYTYQVVLIKPYYCYTKPRKKEDDKASRKS